MRLYDLSGRQVIAIETSIQEMESKFNSEFQNLQGGIYLLQVEGSSLHQKLKLVKM